MSVADSARILGTTENAVKLRAFHAYDLAFANNDNSDITVLLNKGDGTFAAGLPYIAGQVPIDLTAGDLNADGRTDLVVIDQNYGTTSILFNGCLP